LDPYFFEVVLQKNTQGGFMDARETVLEAVRQSTDKELGRLFHTRSALSHVSFGEIMDIVLCYLALQPDLTIIAKRLKMSDFWREIVQPTWKRFSEKSFGFIERNPWKNESGPMDGCMGAAERYLCIEPGFYAMTLCECLLWPEELAGEKDRSWSQYKKHIEGQTFPKLRRKQHAKKLVAALDFAEEICRILREKKEVSRS